MRRGWVALVLLVSVLGACGDENAPAGAAAPTEGSELSRSSNNSSWDPPEPYEFDLESTCGERSLIGNFHIVVKDGRVAEAKGLDQSGRFLVDSEFSDDIPTLQELLVEAREAEEMDADVVEMRFDAKDGHPTSIEIDYHEQAIDDEACYYVTKYRQL